MGSAAAGTDASSAQPQQQAAPMPSAGEAAGSAATGAAASRGGRLGGALGGLGGLGGFGRRKKTEEQQAPPPQQTGNAPQQASGGNPGMLMEVTSELTNFSSGPVDSSKFEVPAGFKQVQHQLEKELKK
jgi:hypothetical protein